MHIGLSSGAPSGMAGTTEVPGVWVAGNTTDLAAQGGASAAARPHPCSFPGDRPLLRRSSVRPFERNS
ncbi:hypothetical protein [Streptomyces atroolivaceus]|uniref:hypothetical protein n=1 Tax=Streptomyces atroolivaceus TaxID=66869 RepID=UPI003642BF37